MEGTNSRFPDATQRMSSALSILLLLIIIVTSFLASLSS
jgi:hypothetical protein